MVKLACIAVFCMLFATVFTLPLSKSAEKKNGNFWFHFLAVEQFNSYFFLLLISVGEYGDYFQGDMILDDEQMDDLFSPARNGLVDTKYRWPNKTLIYQLTDRHTKEQNAFIEEALKTLESVSCVRFKRRTHEQEYVQLTVSLRAEISPTQLIVLCITPFCRQKIVDVIHWLALKIKYKNWIYKKVNLEKTVSAKVL